MKELTDTIKVFIKGEDFKNTQYLSHDNCALATALKRDGYEIGIEDGIGGVSACIQGKEYLIDNCYAIQAGYKGVYPNGVEVILTRI